MSGLRCGFIGLGAMGGPMAGHLHSRGLLRVVGRRSVERARALAQDGSLRIAAGPEDFAACDLVALCVPGDGDVLSNVGALAEVLAAGAIVIDHSTVARDTALQAGRMLESRGLAFLDAPVSGGVEGARNGRLSVMVGGAADVLERARPVLEAYAARITHMGPQGAGQATKAVNQVLVAGIAEAVCEGLALGEALGLQPEALLPTLGAGAAGNWFLERRGATLLRDEFTPGFKCAHLLKDLRIVQAMAREAGIAHGTIDAALQDYAALVERGHGDEDTSALIRLKRPAPSLR